MERQDAYTQEIQALAKENERRIEEVKRLEAERYELERR